MARYYIIAGESSGDMHAANLMKAINDRDPQAEFRVWGGDRMREAGGDVVKHIRELAFMGFWEVIANLPTIFGLIRHAKRDLHCWKPDALILVDYPGFNLKMAAFAKAHQIPVVYYISPQVWAWKKSRVKKIRKVVDKMLVILPFEKEFYQRHDMVVEFPGHPLLDEVIPKKKNNDYVAFKKKHLLPDKPLVALLPGSRKQEIRRMLQSMVALAPDFPECHFVVAGLSSHDPSTYDACARYDNVSLVYDETYALLANANAALVASGTATLETAMFGVPQAVCYKANHLSYLIARQVICVPYISLVNLIMNKPVLREIIQDEFTHDNLKEELHRLLHDQSYRDRLAEEYALLEQKLGGEGASAGAARIITDEILSCKTT